MDNTNKEEDFDPFNPISKKSSEDKIEKKSDDNINILYITGAVILLLIVIWIIVIIITKNNNIEILNEMSKSDNQKTLAVDK